MPSPSGSTAKYGLPYLEELDVPDVATASELLAEGLDSIIASSFKGVASAIPSAGKSGRFYFATDTGALSYDTGSAWMTVLLGTTETPNARMYPTAGVPLASGSGPVQQIHMTQDYAYGGATVTGDTIVVPVKGIYGVDLLGTWDSSSVVGNALASAFLYVNGSPARRWNQDAGPFPFPAPGGSTGILLNAADVLTVWFDSAYNANTESGSENTWLDVSLRTRVP
jgi:hypothetical protein